MKITGIECHILLIPDYDPDACSSAQDNIVVEVMTDEGVVGVGETDTNPWVARECIQARGTHCMGLGLSEMLMGANPLEPETLWDKLYSGSKMTGRRGAVIAAMGAIDMALWDIKGQVLGIPIHELLGGPVKRSVTPYASLLPTGHTLEEMRVSLVEKVVSARRLGFKAAKLEVCILGPYSHNGLQERDEDVVSLTADCRAAAGPDMVLMLDVAYAWNDSRRALAVLQALEPYDLFFVETPLDIDDLEGHAFLHDESPIRIAAGEWQNTHFEFLDLADRGMIDVLQPDVGRVGGFTEAKRVAEIARSRNRQVVPHCWKSAIGIAASVHLAAATSCCPYVEFLPPELSESPLRRDLVLNEPQIVDGELQLPQKPGLGIQLNREVLERYRDERFSIKARNSPHRDTKAPATSCRHRARPDYVD